VVIVDPFRERRRVSNQRPVSIPAAHCTADGSKPGEIEPAGVDEDRGGGARPDTSSAQIGRSRSLSEKSG
jgi:hypothetical protein